jgi:CRISPR-associated protein Csb2
MLAIAFTFPSGRYHATPWDRHVNEGAVAWPPEPWRVLRTLVATWHRKVKPLGGHEESTLHRLIESLSKCLPEYALPPASHSHTRHYMPQQRPEDKKLVFDAFAAVSRDDCLIVAWPDLDLPQQQLALLDDLLAALGYLGRAESWVEARRYDGPFQPNCRPGSGPGEGSLPADSAGEPREEIVPLLAPLTPGDYEHLRESFLADKKAAKKLAKTLPETLSDALSVDTSELRALGWSQPPASRRELYRRPADALHPRRTPRAATPLPATTARYVVVGKPLPRTEDTLRIGELLRRAVMSEAKQQFGERAIPAAISGHGMPDRNRHRHAFYLPWDQNNDGRLDRLIFHLPDGMDLPTRRVAEALNRLWSRDGGEWGLVLENIATADAGGLLMSNVKEWASVTPYLHPWYVKRGFDVAAQIKRECRERGMPEPTVLDQLDEIDVGRGRRCRPIHFRRFRSRHGLPQPDRIGSFWRLTFPAPVPGPLALGFACHFGLGLFAPVPGARAGRHEQVTSPASATLAKRPYSSGPGNH